MSLTIPSFLPIGGYTVVVDDTLEPDSFEIDHSKREIYVRPEDMEGIQRELAARNENDLTTS